MNREEYKGLVGQFSAELAEACFAIKYEVITPDCDAITLVVTLQADKPIFFVLWQSDFVPAIDVLKKAISTWHGAGVIGFWDPEKNDIDKSKVHTKPSGPFNVVLAQVDPPKENYWAEHIRIMPGDNIPEALSVLSDKDKQTIMESIAKIMSSPRAAASGSFLDTYRQAQNHTVDSLGVNDSNYVFFVYANKLGGVEMFYNRVNKD